MRKLIKRMVIMAVIGAVVQAVWWRRGRGEFDPARPSHEWGTTSLTIDEPEAPVRPQ